MYVSIVYTLYHNKILYFRIHNIYLSIYKIVVMRRYVKYFNLGLIAARSKIKIGLGINKIVR